MAYIAIRSTSETSISVRLEGLDINYKLADRTCRWYLDGAYVSSISLGAQVLVSAPCTFSGLSPGKTYQIEAYITAPGLSAPVSLYNTATTDGLSVAPWSWTASNGYASSTQTRNAYYAVTGNGSLSDFSYLVWNDMVDKVYEIMQAEGGWWDNQFASYTATKMSSGDKALTARRFNSLRYNIGRHYSTGINTVSPGETVYGWYFTQLANCINRWIG